MRPQLHIAALYLSANDAALQRKTLIRQAQEHLSTSKAEFLFMTKSSKKPMQSKSEARLYAAVYRSAKHYVLQ